VHGLLQGERMWIEPRGFEEIHSRGNVEQHRLQDPSKWVPYGVGAIEGQAARALPVLDAGTNGGSSPDDGMTATERAASDTNAGMVDPESLIPEAQRDYGPGQEPRPREGEPTASAHGELL